MLSARFAPLIALLYGNVYVDEYKHEQRLKKLGLYSDDGEPAPPRLGSSELKSIHEDRSDHPSPSMQREARSNREAYQRELERQHGDMVRLDISCLASDIKYPSPAVRFLVDLFYSKQKPINTITSDPAIANEVISCSGKVLNGVITKEPVLDTVATGSRDRFALTRPLYNRTVSMPLSTLIKNCFNARTLEKIQAKDSDLYHQLQESFSLFERGLKKWGREQDPSVAFLVRTNRTTNMPVEFSLTVGNTLEALNKFYEKNLLSSGQKSVVKPSHLTQWVMRREAEEAAKSPDIDLETLLESEP